MNTSIDSRVGTIYYLIPDIHKRNLSPVLLYRSIRKGELKKHIRRFILAKHRPVGGIKVMYQHCLLLKELGYNAVPVRMGDYVGNFFGYPIETVPFEEIGYRLQPNDVVVCPEMVPYLGLQFECGRRVLFAQNLTPLYERLRTEDSGKNYAALGYNMVITCSSAIKGRINRDSPEKIFLIRNFIDHTRFMPKPEVRVEGRVMVLTRKNRKDLDKLMELVAAHNIDFRLIDNVSEQEIITEYQKADIFLATGYPEGFGLPPLEAMACGAAVVGFTGGGGSEFMVDGKTALVAEDGDVEAAAKKLLQLLSDPAGKESIRGAGTAMARQYSAEVTKAQLRDFIPLLFDN